MSCRIFLIRHGETTWNAMMKVQGHSDVSLSDRGREQAQLLAGRLARVKIDRFYSSDLLRAKETAMIVAQPHGMDVATTPALREMNFGRWEGLTLQEVEKEYPGALKSWWNNPLHIQIPEAESLAEMAERCVNQIKSIIQDHDHETVAVVSHGGAIRSIISSVLGMDLNEYWRLHLDNTCLNLIEFTRWERGVLKLLNDCTHLEANH